VKKFLTMSLLPFYQAENMHLAYSKCTALKHNQGFQDISSTENSLLVVSFSSDVRQSALTYNFSFFIYNVIQCDTHTLYHPQTCKLNALVQSLFVLHTYIHTYITCKQTPSVMELYKQTLKAVLTQ